MSELKATPGPWRLNPDGSISDCTPASNVVADVELSADWDYCGMAYANAHLIAAAPELYEALESLLTEACKIIEGRQSNIADRDGIDISYAIDLASLALSKARGES